MLEEIARIYGYDRIPETRMADPLPPQRGNPVFEWEQHARDLLADLALAGSGQLPADLAGTRRPALPAGPNKPDLQADYVRVINPITPERNVLRRSLTASLLESAEKNRAATRWRCSRWDRCSCRAPGTPPVCPWSRRGLPS